MSQFTANMPPLATTFLVDLMTLLFDPEKVGRLKEAMFHLLILKYLVTNEAST